MADEREEQIEDIVGMLKSARSAQSATDANDLLLQRLERGQKSRRGSLMNNKDLFIEEDENNPALNLRQDIIEGQLSTEISVIDQDIAEMVAAMTLKGMTIAAICMELNNNTAIGAVHEYKARDVRKIIASKECRSFIESIKDEMKNRSKDSLNMALGKAVERLVKGLDSTNEKASLACAKEIIKLVGIGAEQEALTKQSASEVEDKQLNALLKALTGGGE